MKQSKGGHEQSSEGRCMDRVERVDVKKERRRSLLQEFKSCCNATEISEREYLRLAMKEPLDNRFAIFRAEQERLRKVSADRASKWPNTLVNLRLLREQAQLDKIKNEEREMIKRDKENVGLRHKERLDLIDKANSLLEKPHVKALQTKAWINDVMKERVEQIKLTKIWKDKWIEKEKYYHNEMLKTVAKLNQEEEEKSKKAYETQKLLIKVQNEQVEMIHKRVAEEKEEQSLEKERLKKQLADDEAKEIAKLQAKKEKFLAGVKEVAEINKSTQGAGAIIVAREKELEEEIKLYWEKQKIREAGLKKIKEEKSTAKRKRAEIMADRLDKLYKALAIKLAGDEEKHRIAKEKAEDEFWAAKVAKAKALEAECHKSQQLQIKTKKEKLEEEKKDIAFEDEIATKHIQQLIEEEKQEESNRYNHNKKVAQFCIDQKNKKKEAERIAKEIALSEDIEALIQLKQDEDYLKGLKFE